MTAPSTQEQRSADAERVEPTPVRIYLSSRLYAQLERDPEWGRPIPGLEGLEVLHHPLCASYVVEMSDGTIRVPPREAT